MSKSIFPFINETAYTKYKFNTCRCEVMVEISRSEIDMAQAIDIYKLDVDELCEGGMLFCGSANDKPLEPKFYDYDSISNTILLDIEEDIANEYLADYYRESIWLHRYKLSDFRLTTIIRGSKANRQIIRCSESTRVIISDE